ncbi:MAG: hypothetical protein WA220_11500 [Candidatus Nitrosopolaris sp.]
MFVVLAVTTLTGGDINDANSTGSSDNNRQISSARFVFSSFVNLADFGRDRTT